MPSAGFPLAAERWRWSEGGPELAPPKGAGGRGQPAVTAGAGAAQQGQKLQAPRLTSGGKNASLAEWPQESSETVV